MPADVREEVARSVHVVYRVKKAGRGRVKQRAMTPLECLGRLAVMVPPPRYPLVRLHGQQWHAESQDYR